MSDTPRTDARRGFHGWYTAVDAEFSEKLERELNAAHVEIERLTAKVAQLYEGSEEQKQRIKRLQEAGDELYEGWIGYGFTKDKHLAAWRKAKEAKP